jgi:peptidoglycan hydrolase-like protein with peptidoglycan-binding domain
MAPRSAGSRSSRRQMVDDDDVGGIADFVSRHRFAVAGVTAFAVAFSYVAANAIWYQPHAHGGAFFETRPISGDLAFAPPVDADEEATIIRLEPEGEQPAPQADGEGDTADVETVLRDPPQQPSAPIPPVATEPEIVGDPVIKEVQRVLSGLKFYDGTVDGLTGPRTRDAVETYRKTMGLSVSAEIDQALLDQLGIAGTSTTPPLPESSPGTDLIETASAGPAEAARTGDPTIMRIQAGLKAFGNDGIEVDGVVGSRTRSAILEFQSLFGLPETGQPDSALYTKMREIGLTE